MSKIYLLERRESNLGYDEYHNFVVVAPNPMKARELCAEESADEGEGTWYEAKITIVGDPKDPKPRIVLGDFNAG